MRKILLVLVGLIFIGLFALIPDLPSTAYPPNTPLPPIPVTEEPTPYIVNAAYPQWIYMDCNPEARVEIGWYAPPSDALPFSFSNPGYLNVGWYQHLNQYYLAYDGIDEYGWHRWWATYPVHDGTAELSAFVRAVDGEVFWVYPEFEYLTCHPDNLYLPYISR